MTRRLRGALVLLGTAALALGIAACGNAQAVTQTTLKPKSPLPLTGPDPGVTSNSIDVGTLATETGPLAPGFGEIVNGAEAYFDLINSQGGVNGRKIYIKYQENDGGSTTNDETEARTLVEQDHVFAVVAVGTAFFTGSTFLAQSGTPTFGYVVTQDWNKYPNLFGAYGSYLDYTTEEPTSGYLASAFHAKSVAVLAYSFGPSAQPCADIADGGQTLRLPPRVRGPQLRHRGVPDSRRTEDEERRRGPRLLVHGGDRQPGLLESHAPVRHEHALRLARRLQPVGDQGQSDRHERGHLREEHVPFEAASQFPGAFPALQQYITTMQKYYPQYVYDDTAVQGWINAEQFVTGLRGDREKRHAEPARGRDQQGDQLHGGRARGPGQLADQPQLCHPPVLRRLRRGRERQDLR